MRHYGLDIAEGTEITNTTVATGTADPSVTPNAGELFFRTDLGKLRIHDGSSWSSILETGDAGISSLLEDGSPQLGAALDLNGQTIVTTSKFGTDNVDNISLVVGDVNGSGNTGDIILTGSDVSSIGTQTAAGPITLTGGTVFKTSAGGSGGIVSLTGGAATQPTTGGIGGHVQHTGGAGSQTGGSIRLTPGVGNSDANAGSVEVRPYSTSSASKLKFFEATTNGGDWISFRAPDNITTSRDYRWFDDDPATVAGQFVTIDASGNLGFAAGSGGVSFPLLADAGTISAPSYSFSGNTDTGMTSTTADVLDFSTAGTSRLQIEANGTLNVAGTTTYETLVTDDDDIPNKKYVDDVFGGANNIEYTYTATASQTTFTGADDNANTLAYTVGFVSVHLNGSKLVDTDFTATNGTSVVLDTAANVDDIVVINVTNVLREFADTTIHNAIINGNFDIWQRGTSLTSGTGLRYLADRFASSSTGSTYVPSRETFTVGQTDVPNNPTYYNRNVVTSVAGAANNTVLLQRIEDVRTFAGEEITLSFYAKADSSKNIATEFSQNFGTGGTPSALVTSAGVTTHALTTSWQKFTVTTTLPSISGKTLGTDINSSFLQLIFFFDAGSDFDARTNTLGQQSGTFDIAQVQVEKGAFATQFEKKLTREILSSCERYYTKTFNIDVDPAQNVTFLGGLTTASTSTGALRETGKYPIRMRVIPTITTYNPSATGTGWRRNDDVNSVAASVSNIGDASATFAGSGATANAGYVIQYSADAEL